MVIVRCGGVEFHQIEAIVFDKDGTLADSHTYLSDLGQKRAHLLDAEFPGIGRSLLQAFGLQGDALDPGGLLAVGTRQENEVAAAAYLAATGWCWVESLQRVQAAFAQADDCMPAKADHTPPFGGAIDLLRSLAQAGVRLGILSADSTANVTNFMHRYRLESLVLSGMGIDSPPGKPHPAPFYRICKALATQPCHTLMVGDSLTDLEMARAAGAAGSVGVTWGWTETTTLAMATAVIDRFDQIQVVMD